MLEVTELSVRLGRHLAVADVSFTSQAGGMVAVLGRNGAGKTTLIRALAGLLPMQGRVRIANEHLHRLPPAERGQRLGYVAQEPALLSARLSVLELLVLAQNGHTMGWRARPGTITAAEAMLEALHLTPLARAFPIELSGGQRQMVSMALALIRGPRLLLLDEPTSALDIPNQLHMLELIRNYTKAHDIVTITILHDLNLALRYADTAIILDRGRLAAHGAATDLLDRDRLAKTFGVDFRVIDTGLAEGHRVIYPLAPLDTPGQRC